MTQLIVGDCLEVMRTMAAESVDAVVTDPPAGISFMGREWDRNKGGREQWVAWMTEVMRECFRLLKPGGHILVWALPRTSHWTGWAIENAGFEPRDKIVHCFASGFPKSLDVSKAMDRAAGAEREDLGESPNWRESKRDREAFGSMEVRGENAGRLTAPATDLARKWEGWGTSLKPAYEDWWLARKPLRGTVAQTVTQYGTGALNIDATRIGTTKDVPASPSDRFGANGIYNVGLPALAERSGMDPNLGRWPANVILTADEQGRAIFDGEVPGVVGGGQSVEGGTKIPRRTSESMFGIGGYSDPAGPRTTDSGSYSRFFLIPKSSRADREPVVRDYAVRLHIERGECDKLSAWDYEAQRLNEQTDSTSLAPATSEETSTDDSGSATSQPGKQPSDRSPRATRSTTSTATSRTTESSTSSSSIPSLTSASTPAASSSVDDGSSPAGSAASSSLWESTTGTSADRDGLSTDAAGRATSAGSLSRNRCVACGKPLPRFSTHPTQKPTELMRHLVRLVTPPGGTVLDCFAGSGSTLLAAEMEGFAWIGIEKEPEYVAICEARLHGTQRGLGLDVGAPTRKRTKTGQQGPTPETNGQARWTEWREASQTPEEVA